MKITSSLIHTNYLKSIKYKSNKEIGEQKIFPLSANYRRERGNIYNKKAGVHNSHIGLCLNRNIYDLERHQSRRHLNLCDVSDFLAQ